MVGDMENLKVHVKNEAESEEAQKLLFELGYDYYFGGKTICNTNLGLVTANEDGLMAAIEVNGFDYKEITLQYLRDLVVLNRNSIDDATHYYGGSKYYLTASEFYQYSEGKWVNIDQYVDGMTFKKIEKDGDMEMKEYLDKDYTLRSVKQTSGDNCVPEDWIEVPEGAEEYRANYKFYKNNGELYYSSYGELVKSEILHYKTLWKRDYTITNNTSTQEKLKFIEKWLNGEKIQYILGIESDKSQWHNFTEGAMQYIKRPDIKFREAPKYVTINGIEFKNVKSLLKHIKNNFDLDGED